MFTVSWKPSESGYPGCVSRRFLMQNYVKNDAEP